MSNVANIDNKILLNFVAILELLEIREFYQVFVKFAKIRIFDLCWETCQHYTAAATNIM